MMTWLHIFLHLQEFKNFREFLSYSLEKRDVRNLLKNAMYQAYIFKEINSISTKTLGLSPGWPDLAGKDYKAAISKITQDYLGVTVIYGPKGYMRIQDFQLDRVWLDVNPNGMIAGVPAIG